MYRKQVQTIAREGSLEDLEGLLSSEARKSFIVETEVFKSDGSIHDMTTLADLISRHSG